MQEITEKIITHIKTKYTFTYKKWYIGLTDNPQKTKKEFESTNKIVCEYFKFWPCKNKNQARKILKELEPLGTTICRKTPKPIIFTFLSIDKNSHKIWKILNTQKPTDFLILK